MCCRVCWGIASPVEYCPIHRITIEMLEMRIAERLYRCILISCVSLSCVVPQRQSQARRHQTQAFRTMLPSTTLTPGHMMLPADL